MATCIKTGAFVYFEEYGYASAADLFECGDQVLVQWNSNGRYFQDFPRTISHRIRIGQGYHHEDRGVTVVPTHSITLVS